jgi:hypothetical protein
VTARESIDLIYTPEGRRLLVSRQVDAPPSAAWELFRDTTRWPEWGPSITAVECEDRRIEAGTEGYVRTIGGLRLPFLIETCSDSDRRWTWRVAGIGATGHRVETIEGEAGCRIGFEVPLWAMPYVPVPRRALRRMDSILARD